MYVEFNDEIRRARAKSSHVGSKGRLGKQTVKGLKCQLILLEDRSLHISSHNAVV